MHLITKSPVLHRDTSMGSRPLYPPNHALIVGYCGSFMLKAEGDPEEFHSQAHSACCATHSMLCLEDRSKLFIIPVVTP